MDIINTPSVPAGVSKKASGKKLLLSVLIVGIVLFILLFVLFRSPVEAPEGDTAPTPSPVLEEPSALEEPLNSSDDISAIESDLSEIELEGLDSELGSIEREL